MLWPLENFLWKRMDTHDTFILYATAIFFLDEKTPFSADSSCQEGPFRIYLVEP